jgi:hypothetical protein
LTALESIQFFYALLLPISGILTLVTLRNIGVPVAQAGVIAAATLLSPLSLYLAYKSLGDVPALLLALAAAASLTAGLRSPRYVGGAGVISGIFLALSTMASWTGPLLVLGIGIALLLTPPPGVGRRVVLFAGLIAATTTAAGLVVGLRLLGGSVDDYRNGLVALIGFSKGLSMSLFAIFSLGLFGGVLWILAPLSVLSHNARLRRIFVVWLAIAIVLVWVLGAGFLEPRYLTGALVPLAGLAVMGAQAAWDRVTRFGRSTRLRVAVATVVSLTAVGSAAALQPIAPYELDQHDMIRLVNEQAVSKSAVMLIPWNYSDFHFLRFAFPDRPVFLVQTAATEAGQLVHDDAWTTRFAAMYGDHYLASAAAVSSSISDGPMLYVGWTVLPSFQNLRAILVSVGMTRLAGFVDASQFRNHMVESWLVDDSGFTLREVAKYGQYHVFDVKRRQPWAVH